MSTFKQKRSVLLVMYRWLNGFYCEMNVKYSLLRQKLTMLFVTKATPIGYIDSKFDIKKQKISKTCLIGYLAFISREWFLIAYGVDTHTHTHVHMHTYRHPHENNFKKPGVRRPSACPV